MKTPSTAAVAGAAAALVTGLAAVLAGPAPLALADQPDRPARLPIELPDVGHESFQGIDKALQC
ncbi:hypothetical protein AS594_16840 [Streptomyces agglomeratus]|uniref:Alpha/beta hydrolase n=1 Tax=Streptomyces agglomeratus TaxID=285458 RepID=A0A1E5P8S5_9ACTN|nr:hypothetical protein [Streptomyces agglomeratus]OEJ25918.1 hypothetical protein AS594_16840 [Streptomyces agglomeratus]OEJ52575.1 hypothetical protein BGK72_19185 [Streptomyces agglomeratus]